LSPTIDIEHDAFRKKKRKKGRLRCPTFSPNRKKLVRVEKRKFGSWAVKKKKKKEKKKKNRKKKISKEGIIKKNKSYPELSKKQNREQPHQKKTNPQHSKIKQKKNKKQRVFLVEDFRENQIFLQGTSSRRKSQIAASRRR